MKAREHWEAIYRTKPASEVSWFQPRAVASLDLVQRVARDPDDSIIDVGGGASTLVDGLLDLGYRNVTVLDLSAAALATARERLGSRSALVRWIQSDVLAVPFRDGEFALWHDRACFHFLTSPADRARYAAQMLSALKPGGHAVVASFALDGPPRCSGLEVVRYSPESLRAELGPDVMLLDSVREEHHTPAGAAQAFVYCLFRIAG